MISAKERERAAKEGKSFLWRSKRLFGSYGDLRGALAALIKTYFNVQFFYKNTFEHTDFFPDILGLFYRYLKEGKRCQRGKELSLAIYEAFWP